jgi:Carboxypeptidase regulatory-like domain
VKRALHGFLLSILTCTAAWAQSTAQISGVVRDQSGAILPGVDVAATQTATGAKRATATNENGAYTLPNLPIGPYMLEASLPGFRAYVQTGIILQVNDSAAINVTLEIGQISEQVEVQANATLVETQSTGVGRVIDNQRVLELPLNGRQATELIFLSGMATPGTGATSTTTRNYPTIQVAVAGGLATGVAYNLDGANINDPYNGLNLPIPFPDALQEFKVETSGLAAQYGTYSSAAVNAVTKAGTNQFHGDLFEFVRNQVFNARNSFATTRDPLKRNQFGGTIGGPLLKNKLFFFGGYQETTVRAAPSESFGYVPTPQMMTGDFNTFNVCSNRSAPLPLPFGNNTISPAAFSPAAVAFQKRLPTTADPCGKVYFAKINKSNEFLVPARVDYQVNDKHSLFGRFNFSRLDQASQYDGKNILTLDAGASPLRVYEFVLGDTYLIGPGMVSSFRGSVNRTNIVKKPPDFPDLGAFGVNAYLYKPATLRVTVTNGFTAGTNNGTFSQYNTTAFQFAEDISLIRGKHQIGFGGSWIHQQLNALSMVFATAPVTFNGTVTVTGSNLGLVDFLLGKPSSFQQGSPGLFYYRLDHAGLYLQDSYKVHSRLTINPGLRWEPYLPVFVDDIGLSYFDRAAFDAGVKSTVFPNAPAGLKFPGDAGMPGGRRVGFHRMVEMAPRLGIAWDPTGKGKTSVRAAYGIFYNRPNLTTYGGYSSSPPNGNSVTVQNPASFDNPWGNFAGGDPFPVNVTKNYTFPLAGSYYAFTPQARPTYQNQWNLTLQQELGSNLLVSAAYLGTNIIHMWTGGQLNPAVYIPGSCVLNGVTTNPCSTLGNIQSRRVLNLANPKEGQYYGTISGLDDGGTGNYHGMLLSVQRRTAKGLTVSTNYTWSHCIADIVKTSQTAAEYVTPGDRSSSRGNCGSDRRHSFNSSSVYQTPGFANPTMKTLFSNWQVSAIVKLLSGQYFDVTAGSDRALTGTANQRVNQVLVNVFVPNKSASQWLNPNAFTLPVNGTYGAIGAMSVRGPHSIQIDMGLTRSFQVREKQSIQFRWEAFNVPNLVNLNNPVSAFNNVNFGKILSSNDPRIMQVALKYVF